VIGGVMMKLWMFVLRLSHSGKAVHVAYANQAQESFLDGHVVAFERLGGVPTAMIPYDNLTAAVIRLVLGRDRVENPRFIALRSTYGFEVPRKSGHPLTTMSRSPAEEPNITQALLDTLAYAA
jgi:transposase